MATVLITYNIMPDDAATDLNNHQDEIFSLITSFGGKVLKTETRDVAFGLKSLNIIFELDEKKGDTEELEHKLEKLHYIQSVNVEDVRRLIG